MDVSVRMLLYVTAFETVCRFSTVALVYLQQLIVCM